MRTIAHRFLLAVAALLVAAAPAGAAEVARIDGATLHVRDGSGTELCITVSEGESEYSAGSGECARAPWRPRRAALVTWLGQGERVLVGGAVPASVARGEAELADGRRIGFATVAGRRYRGRYAGRLRFYLAALPVADRGDTEAGGVVLVRFFGADGTLEAVAAADREGTPVAPRRVLLRERAGRRATTVLAEERRTLAPTPLALDRVETLTCLRAEDRTRQGVSSSSSICRDEGPGRPALTIFPESGCGGLRTVLYGFVGDAVTAVRLRLGSDRVREVRTRTLRDSAGREHRYVATAVPRGEAVRSIHAVGADADQDLGEPPSGLPCVGQAGWVAYAFLFGFEEGPARPPAGDEQVAAEAGGHRLLVRDAEGERLCAGIDRLLAYGTDCVLPAVNGEDAYGLVEEGVVAAVLPAEVASVRLPGGRVVPTVEGAYRGRYTGALRFFLAEIADAGGQGPFMRFRMLDAGGVAIGSFFAFDPSIFAGSPGGPQHRLASGRGWRLGVARRSLGACLFVTVRGDDPVCIDSAEAGSDGATAVVGCTPRVAVLAGTLSRETRSVRAVLRGGRTLRARILRIPRRYGGGRAFVLALPRGARMRAIRFDDRSAALPVLPASDQCGYQLTGPSFAQAEIEVEARG